ncbi:MAG: hypothetical protein AB1690_00560, partial [Candidatus Zixiibacteriota bacterium]
MGHWNRLSLKEFERLAQEEGLFVLGTAWTNEERAAGHDFTSQEPEMNLLCRCQRKIRPCRNKEEW